MKTENETRGPQPEEKDSKWGLILVLVFVIGIPILGILYGVFFAKPDQ